MIIFHGPRANRVGLDGLAEAPAALRTMAEGLPGNYTRIGSTEGRGVAIAHFPVEAIARLLLTKEFMTPRDINLGAALQFLDDMASIGGLTVQRDESGVANSGLTCALHQARPSPRQMGLTVSLNWLKGDQRPMLAGGISLHFLNKAPSREIIDLVTGEPASAAQTFKLATLDIAEFRKARNGSPVPLKTAAAFEIFDQVRTVSGALIAQAAVPDPVPAMS
jgi:hypothetical protein